MCVCAFVYMSWKICHKFFCMYLPFIPLYGLISRRLTNSLCLCSFLPLLRPRERDSGSEWRPGAALPSGPGTDGRGQNVVPEERLGRCKICKIVTQDYSGVFFPSMLVRKVAEKVARFHRTCLFFDDPLDCDCFCLPFISHQVLEAHGLKPISLKPKEVMFKTQQHSLLFDLAAPLTQGSVRTRRLLGHSSRKEVDTGGRWKVFQCTYEPPALYLPCRAWLWSTVLRW